jgi:VIT1/CCC1 family predicted Fe2+/Mn2+ transporter
MTRLRSLHVRVRGVLDPTDALTEELFGVVMALTITLGAGLIIEEGEQSTRHLLFGILGCNMAWGMIDGSMYLLGCMLERSARARLLLSIQGAVDNASARAVIARELDPRLAALTSPEERVRLYDGILSRLRNTSPEHTRMTREDIQGAIVVWWLVFLTSLPAVLPFVFIDDRFVALRVSNALLLILLFITGYNWARVTHANPWWFGSIALLVGAVMVAVVMAFGG